MAKRGSGVTKKTSNKIPGWIWMLMGSGITLIGVFALYLINPFAKKTSTEELTQTTPVAEEPSEDYNFYELLPEQQVEITGEPEDSIVVTSGIEDQAKSLETQTESDQTDIEISQETDSGAEPATSNTSITQGSIVAPPTQYALKLGVFQQADEADRQRARVLLTGIVASVQPIITSDGMIYSLVSEPFANRSEALQAQQQLQNGGIQSVISGISEY